MEQAQQHMLLTNLPLASVQQQWYLQLLTAQIKAQPLHTAN
jgi:hypothetical protein